MQHNDETLAHTTKIAAGVVGAVATVGALAKFAKGVKRWVARPDAYSERNKIRHDQLRKSYTHFLRASPPDKWEIDKKHRPVSSLTIADLKYELQQGSANLDAIHSASIHQSAKSMHATLLKLLDSLAKRKNKPLKTSCVDILFLSEVVDWLLNKLPACKLDDKQTLSELCARSEYFENALNNILDPDKGRDAGTRNNPIVALESMIGNLRSICVSTEELIELRTFSDHIDELDNTAVSMSAEIFNAMHLLIKGKHSFETTFQVGLFLDRSQIHRPTYSEFQKKRLAFWLEETLRVLGIKSTGFISTKHISLETIEKHLASEFSESRSFPKELFDVAHDDWGHWLVLFENSPVVIDKTAVLKERLSHIREIYQGVLSLYYLRQLLAHARKVAPVSGEVWFFGDKIGHSVIVALMTIASKIIQGLNAKVSDFHEKNKLVFESLRSASVIQHGTESYMAISAAHDRLDDYQKQYQRALLEIGAIEKKRDVFHSRVIEASESRQALIHDIINFMQHNHMVELADYDVLKKSLANESASEAKHHPIIQPATEEEIKLKQKSLALAYRQESKECQGLGIGCADSAQSPQSQALSLIKAKTTHSKAIPSEQSVLPKKIGAFQTLCRLVQSRGLTAAERVRYDALVCAYEQLLGASSPPEWEHIDDAELSADFHTLTYKLQAKLDIMSRVAPASIHHSAKGILGGIVKLYDSLSKRWLGKIKSNSVEELFFTELANWVVKTLPGYDFKNKDTLFELKKRLTYCEDVYKNVLIPEANTYLAQRNNPLPVLTCIKQDIEGIIGATTELVHSATLDDRLRELDNAILEMGAQAFHMMYFLINGDHRAQHGLPVDLFLDDKQKTRPKITEIKKQQLATWLKNMLLMLGIKGNDFNNSKRPTLTEIDELFAGECPTDPSCQLPKSLRDPSSESWGHWLFLFPVDKQQKKILCAKQAEAIREIYKNILKVYDLRHMIAHARKVAPVYGEASLYGDDTGRAIMDTLIGISKNTTKELSTSLSAFHSPLSKKFTALKGQKISPKELGYIAMGLVSQQMESFLSYYGKGLESIAELETQCKMSTSRIARAETSKIELLKEVVNFSNQRGLRLSPRLKLAYSRLHEDQFLILPSFVKIAAPPKKLSQLIDERCHEINPRATVLNLSQLRFDVRKLDNKADPILDTLLEFFSGGGVKKINAPITSINFRNNGFYSNNPAASVSLKLLFAELHRLPPTITTIDLRGNGFEAYTREQLSELLQFVPRHIKIHFNGKKPLGAQDHLSRLNWPFYFHQMAKEASGDMLQLAYLLLNDYTKGNSALLRFFTFNGCHSHVADVCVYVDRIRKGQYPNIASLLKELSQFEPTNPVGTLSTRLSFLYHHAYKQLGFHEFNDCFSTQTEEEVSRSACMKMF